MTVAAHPAQRLRRDVCGAANAMRAGGLNTLDTIEHLAFLLLLRMAGGDLPQLAPLRAAVGGDVLARARAARHPARVLAGARDAIARGVAPGDPMRFLVEGFHPRIEDAGLLRRVLDTVDALALDHERLDVNGAVYEQLIATLSDAGHLGQYFTPRHVVETMVALVEPQAGESVYDPAAGTGGFLMAAARAAPGLELHGRELNGVVQRLCATNLLIHGLSLDGLLAGDSLAATSQRPGAFDVVLSNPPFASTVTADARLPSFPVASRSAEALFLQHAVAALRPGGRAAIVCPEGLLANVGGEADVRRWVMTAASVEAVISLPAGVFNPYTPVRTGILVLRHGGPTRRVWFFDVRRDGFSLDTRRRPGGGSDLPAVVAGFRGREVGPRAALVDRAAVDAHGGRLVAARYLGTRHGADAGAVETRALGAVCGVVKETVRPSDEPDRAFAYVALEHVGSRTGALAPIAPTAGREIRSVKHRFAAGDVLYGRLRPYLAKVALVGFDGICSAELVVLRPDRAVVDPGYLAAVLRSAAFTERAAALMVGANHPRVHLNDLLAIEIPVPPLAEQRALAARLDATGARIADAQAQIAALRAEADAAVDAVWAPARGR